MNPTPNKEQQLKELNHFIGSGKYKYSIAEVAQEAGMSRQQLSQILQGRDGFSFETYSRIVKALNTIAQGYARQAGLLNIQ